VVFATGQSPRVDGLGLENVGVRINKGKIQTNKRMETNKDSVMDYRVVPRGIRTLPEIGAVGITEQEAREKELEVKIGKYPFTSNAKASMLREGSGFIKVIAEATS
jgi:dihydrolipoamide dehydrogenase